MFPHTEFFIAISYIFTFVGAKCSLEGKWFTYESNSRVIINSANLLQEPTTNGRVCVCVCMYVCVRACARVAVFLSYFITFISNLKLLECLYIFLFKWLG